MCECVCVGGGGGEVARARVCMCVFASVRVQYSLRLNGKHHVEFRQSAISRISNI